MRGTKQKSTDPKQMSDEAMDRREALEMGRRFPGEPDRRLLIAPGRQDCTRPTTQLLAKTRYSSRR